MGEGPRQPRDVQSRGPRRLPRVHSRAASVAAARVASFASGAAAWRPAPRLLLVSLAGVVGAGRRLESVGQDRSTDRARDGLAGNGCRQSLSTQSAYEPAVSDCSAAGPPDPLRQLDVVRNDEQTGALRGRSAAERAASDRSAPGRSAAEHARTAEHTSVPDASLLHHRRNGFVSGGPACVSDLDTRGDAPRYETVLRRAVEDDDDGHAGWNRGP